MDNIFSTHKKINPSLEVAIEDSAKAYFKVNSDENKGFLKASVNGYLMQFFSEGKKDIKILDEYEKVLVILTNNSISISDIITSRNKQNFLINLEINYNIERYTKAETSFIRDESFTSIFSLTEGFIKRVVKKENIGRIDEDLMSAGKLGLLSSLHKNYDPLQSNFLTFAFSHIRQYIQHEKIRINPGVTSVKSADIVYTRFVKGLVHEEIHGGNYVLTDEKLDKLHEYFKETGQNITKKSIKLYIELKTSKYLSLDKKIGDDSTLLDFIPSDYSVTDLHEGIDQGLYMEKIQEWLNDHTDFEKAIVENRFGVSFGECKEYNVFSVNCKKNGIEKIKEIPGMQVGDVNNRLSEMGYEILDSRKKIQESVRKVKILGGSIAHLKNYFEIEKATSYSLQKLVSSEEEIVESLRGYLSGFFEGSTFKDLGIKKMKFQKKEVNVS